MQNQTSLVLCKLYLFHEKDLENGDVRTFK